MFEMFWYLFISILEGILMVKMRRVKYVAYKLNEIISADEADIRFQYVTIYLNEVIQDIIKTFKAVG